MQKAHQLYPEVYDTWWIPLQDKKDEFAQHENKMRDIHNQHNYHELETLLPELISQSDKDTTQVVIEYFKLIEELELTPIASKNIFKKRHIDTQIITYAFPNIGTTKNSKMYSSRYSDTLVKNISYFIKGVRSLYLGIPRHIGNIVCDPKTINVVDYLSSLYSQPNNRRGSAILNFISFVNDGYKTIPSDNAQLCIYFIMMQHLFGMFSIYHENVLIPSMYNFTNGEIVYHIEWNRETKNLYVSTDFDIYFKTCMKDQLKMYQFYPVRIRGKDETIVDFIFYDKTLQHVRRFSVFGGFVTNDKIDMAISQMYGVPVSRTILRERIGNKPFIFYQMYYMFFYLSEYNKVHQNDVLEIVQDLYDDEKGEAEWMEFIINNWIMIN